MSSRLRWVDARERFGSLATLMRPFIGRLSLPSVSEKTHERLRMFLRQFGKLIDHKIANKTAVN